MKKQPAIARAMMVIIGVAAWTLIAASAGAQTGPACTGKNHCIDVTIVGGAISPVPDTVITARDHQIYWRIKTSGYVFPPPPPPPAGIAFKPPSPTNDNGHMPAREFPCNRVSATLFHCTDANSTHNAGVRRYQYAITVIGGSGSPVVSDPWIVNK